MTEISTNAFGQSLIIGRWMQLTPLCNVGLFAEAEKVGNSKFDLQVGTNKSQDWVRRYLLFRTTISSIRLACERFPVQGLACQPRPVTFHGH